MQISETIRAQVLTLAMASTPFEASVTMASESVHETLTVRGVRGTATLRDHEMEQFALPPVRRPHPTTSENERRVRTAAAEFVRERELHNGLTLFVCQVIQIAFGSPECA